MLVSAQSSKGFDPRSMLMTAPAMPASLNDRCVTVQSHKSSEPTTPSCPSTPRRPASVCSERVQHTTEPVVQHTAQPFQLGSCTILLPSNGADNDAMRMRNNGRKLPLRATRAGLLAPLPP